MFWDLLLYFITFGIGCGVVVYVVKQLNRLQAMNENKNANTGTSTSTSVESGISMNEQENLFYHSVFANDRTDIFKPGE